MYAIVEKNDDENLSDKKNVLRIQSQLPADVSANKTSIRLLSPVVHPIDESKDDVESLLINNYETQVNHDNILFVYFYFNIPLNRDLISLFRAINNDVQIFSNSITCLEFLQYSNNRIFFISSSNDKELIKEAHDCPAVEIIFIFNSDAQIDRNISPKFVGSYKHSEELLMVLKNAFEWFEQTNLGFFTFEHDQIFLWLQMWKEFIRPINPQIPSNKEKFVEKAENYYRGNKKLLESLDGFDYCYEQSEALQWCFSSPFPSHFIHHALSSFDTNYIDLCRFLINDVSCLLQQPMDFKANHQFYRGLKVTREDLQKLMKHTGKLICPKGFFTCTKSKKVALDLAQLPNYRLDLKPILFKINCPSSVLIGEIPMTGTPGLIVFDVYTAFRVKCVNRGQVSIVKLEHADEDGRNLARAYRMKYESQNVQSLLDQLSTISKPPARLPSIQRPPLNVTPKMMSKKVSPPILSKEEKHAQRLVQHGKVDEALALYQHLKRHSPRVLNTMGQLYADKKGDYNSALKYYEQAMKIQEENGDDVTDTLTHIAIAHHNLREFDLATACHNRALNLQKNNNEVNQSSVASSLLGIANAQWGQENLSEALQNAQQALALNESVGSGNDLNLAMNLAVLANIHHTAGDNTQALVFSQRALTILERCVSLDSLTLASIINNMGAIQMELGLFSDARHSLDRALKICEKTLLPEHPKRVTMEQNIQHIKEIIEKNGNSSKVQS